MPIHYPSLSPSSGSVGGGVLDPVVASAVDLTPANWVDTQPLGDGVALLNIIAAGDGLALQLPNGISGARYVGAVLSGDFLISADFGFATDSDQNVNAGVEVALGVAPGGLSADITNADWHAIRLSGLASQVDAFQIAYIESNPNLNQHWTGTPGQAGLKSVHDVHQIRVAIQRAGASMTFSLLSVDGSRLGIDTEAIVGMGDCDIFLWCRTSKLGTHAHLHRLAISGLGWAGDRLVSQ